MSQIVAVIGAHAGCTHYNNSVFKMSDGSLRCKRCGPVNEWELRGKTPLVPPPKPGMGDDHTESSVSITLGKRIAREVEYIRELSKHIPNKSCGWMRHKWIVELTAWVSAADIGSGGYEIAISWCRNCKKIRIGRSQNGISYSFDAKREYLTSELSTKPIPVRRLLKWTHEKIFIYGGFAITLTLSIVLGILLLVLGS